MVVRRRRMTRTNFEPKKASRLVVLVVSSRRGIVPLLARDQLPKHVGERVGGVCSHFPMSTAVERKGTMVGNLNGVASWTVGGRPREPRAALAPGLSVYRQTVCMHI